MTPTDPEKPGGGRSDDDAPERGAGGEGWEGLAEEPSGGTLAAGDELEAALREAEEAVEARTSRGRGRAPRGGGHDRAVDEATIQALSAELQSLKAEYESTKQELEASRERVLRLTAEFDNFRKRTLKERQDHQLYGAQNLVKDLLGAVDNLERAIEHAGAGEGGGDAQGFREGVELVLRDLLTTLQKHGLEVIEAADQPFDPAEHEAMAQVEDASVAPNTVVQVMQKGYRLRDRMLRPARVVVAKAPSAGGEKDGT